MCNGNAGMVARDEECVFAKVTAAGGDEVPKVFGSKEKRGSVCEALIRNEPEKTGGHCSGVESEVEELERGVAVPWLDPTSCWVGPERIVEGVDIDDGLGIGRSDENEVRDHLSGRVDGDGRAWNDGKKTGVRCNPVGVLVSSREHRGHGIERGCAARGSRAA